MSAPFRLHGLTALFLLLMVSMIAPACNQEEPARDSSKTPDPLLQLRKERDRAFKYGQESPLPEEDKSQFQGLDYYAPNTGFRLRVTLRRYQSPQTIRLVTNTGEQREALRYGYFEFQVAGQSLRLQVFRTFDLQETGAANLFVPFRDATSGKETYGGGRYIDLRENTSGIYELDFNRAYNPSCAYGKGYSCPIPPAENTLPVPITAGEKKYALEHKSRASSGQASKKNNP